MLPEKEREVLENITWKLDKQENETLPQVTLNTLEVSGRAHISREKWVESGNHWVCLTRGSVSSSPGSRSRILYS